MSKLPAQIVRLTQPLRNRWYNGRTYCTGITCTNEIADDIRPLVSSFIQPDIDDNFEPCFIVNTVYCYDSKIDRENQKWHTFVRKSFPTMREALKECESACREAYAFALHNGINKVLAES